MFCRYLLRTSDLVAARAFYADAIGLQLPDGMADGSSLEAWTLHEQAIARGAKPHWLGQLAVDDLDAALARITEAGGERLGPIAQARDGATFAALRDPFGTIVGVRAGGARLQDAPILWHQLHTRDAEGAWRLYSSMFGWAHKDTLDVADVEGGYRMFAWSADGPIVGAIGNSARLAGVHTHWLFFLPVADLDAAAKRVRELGGLALEPVTLPNGMRLVGCDDPQGAAFGLAQRLA